MPLSYIFSTFHALRLWLLQSVPHTPPPLLPQFYGAWTETQQAIVSDFITGIGSTKWFNIIASYFQTDSSGKNRTYVTGPLTLNKTLTDTTYGGGKNLTRTEMRNIVLNAVRNSQLPALSNAMYLILASPEVSSVASGQLSCKDYASSRMSATYNTTGTAADTSSTILEVSLIHNMVNCSAYASVLNSEFKPSCNGDAGVDMLVNYIARTFANMITAPSGLNSQSAWEDAEGNTAGGNGTYTISLFECIALAFWYRLCLQSYNGFEDRWRLSLSLF